jgi:hypothetical protein
MAHVEDVPVTECYCSVIVDYSTVMTDVVLLSSAHVYGTES